MIVDKTENMGEHAWTKLLDDKDSTGKGAVIVKMSDNSLITDVQNIQNLKETSPLTGDLNDTTNLKETGSAELIGGIGGIIGVKDINIAGDEKNVSIQRKESMYQTFHRHLRRSIKAVSESPGPITR